MCRALSLLASLFFMWGFISVINNTLLPHLRSVFDLNYMQTTLIESTWFVGYLVASIPAAKLIARVGFQRAIVIGLAIMTAGSLGMIPAARLPSFPFTLVFAVHCLMRDRHPSGGRKSLCGDPGSREVR